MKCRRRGGWVCMVGCLVEKVVCRDRATCKAVKFGSPCQIPKNRGRRVRVYMYMCV